MKKIRFFYLILILLFLNSVVPYSTTATATATATTTSTDICAKTDTLTFILITDTHICNLTGYNPLFVQSRQYSSKNIEPLIHFLKYVPINCKADFVVCTGDNIDYYEAETAEGEMLDTQVEQYIHLLDSSDVPVYLTLGNHDISTDKGNQLHAERARATWIRNAPCFSDGTYYSQVFQIDTTTFRLIFLDNAYYFIDHPQLDWQFIIDQSQLDWLDDQLKTSNSDIEIIFMHFPLPYGKSYDDSILTEPLKIYSSKTKFYNLSSILEKNSSTSIIFAGHMHINMINNYILSNRNKLTQVMTGAFGNDSNNWRKIQLTADKVIISDPGNSKVELLIPVNNR